MHAKFFNNTPTITLKQLEQFWTWFGPTLQKVRYQRHVASMWTAGLIYGLIERQNVHRILLHQEVGACLIRFSENHPGFFAIGYKIFDDDLEKSVRHYLVTADDIGTKKTLPDFMGESAQFKFIGQVTDQARQQRRAAAQVRAQGHRARRLVRQEVERCRSTATTRRSPSGEVRARVQEAAGRRDQQTNSLTKQKDNKWPMVKFQKVAWC
jgi:hypothetical protein